MVDRVLEPANHQGLLATGELNRSLLEAMPCGIVHVTATGAILASNAEALRILGLTHDALTNRYTEDFGSETIKEDGSPCAADEYPVTRALATAKAQPPVTIGVRRQDGTTSWAIYTAVPIVDPTSSVVSGAVVTFLDITDRKRQEAALRHSEELLRSVLDSAPNPIATADRDGNLLLLSKTPGPRHTHALGRPAWGNLLPEEHPKAKAAFERVLTTGARESYEALRAPAYAGSSIWGRAVRERRS